MKTVYTHAGVFHADEVIGCALIASYFEYVEIVRLEDVDVEKTIEKERDNPDALFLDVGGRYSTPGEGAVFLDHHQDRTLPCAAVLAAEWLKARFSSIDLTWADAFLPGVDDQDRGLGFSPKGTMSLSNVIGAYVPVNLSCRIHLRNRFDEAMAMAVKLFEIMQADHYSKKEYHRYVRNRLGCEVVVLDRSGPGASMVASEHPDSRFVVAPGARTGWALHRVEDAQPNKGDRIPRALISPEACKRNGCSFLHANGFMAVFPTKEQAISAAEESLAQNV